MNRAEYILLRESLADRETRWPAFQNDFAWICRRHAGPSKPDEGVTIPLIRGRVRAACRQWGPLPNTRYNVVSKNRLAVLARTLVDRFLEALDEPSPRRAGWPVRAVDGTIGICRPIVQPELSISKRVPLSRSA